MPPLVTRRHSLLAGGTLLAAAAHPSIAAWGAGGIPAQTPAASPCDTVLAEDSNAVPDADPDAALIAITLDLEMSRNFPTWDAAHWDYEKGNLNEETKRYAAEAARRVRAAGGVLHCFAVGRVFEQERVDWLADIVRAGHPVGNHTYDHVNVLARDIRDVQYRFARAPWLAEGKNAAALVRENVRLCELAMRERLGIAPAGFRTPGGFPSGLRERADVRAMLLDLGYSWVSSLYPPHANTGPGEPPGDDVYASIVAAQRAAQPFIYDDGLIEIPMSPISDIGAFRTGRWKLDWFLTAVRRCVAWAIAHRATFDFLAHPSCLYVTDPEFRAIDLICELVRDSAGRARIVGLEAFARRAANAAAPQRRSLGRCGRDDRQ